MADRETRERKLMALMVNDLGPGFGEKEIAKCATSRARKSGSVSGSGPATIS